MAPGSGARLVADTLGWRHRREACAPGCEDAGKHVPWAAEALGGGAHPVAGSFG